METERVISEKGFIRFKNKSTVFIKKWRYLYPCGKLVWEIDVFDGLNLIMAEVELPTENYKFKIPKFISDQLLLELTQFEQFSNKNLATKIIK